MGKQNTIENLIVTATTCRELCQMHCKVCILDLLNDLRKELQVQQDKCKRCNEKRLPPKECEYAEKWCTGPYFVKVILGVVKQK